MSTEIASLPFVSVIIPTYNRRESLLRTLESLRQQTFPSNRFEVIVVDDGSNDKTLEVTATEFPFQVLFLSQKNQGATVARNLGASASKADLLVFVDDDITLLPQTIDLLVAECARGRDVVALGRLIMQSSHGETIFTRQYTAALFPRFRSSADCDVQYYECLTGLMAVKRDNFLRIGMFQDPTGGWPNWDDVDFGYRARKYGFRFCENSEALAVHWDHGLDNLTAACSRWQRASKSAVRLLHRYPELAADIPMFHDKGPINPKADGFRLSLRKLLRYIQSRKLVLAGMEKCAFMIERLCASCGILRPIYRWVTSSYIYLGFQQGLAENHGGNVF